MLNIILNKNINPENEYTDRPTVKAIIVNEEGKILVNSNLIGGGVEENETNEEALHREILEEVGVKSDIVEMIGCVYAYREALKRKYIVHGYVCKYIEKISNQTEENKSPSFWEDPEESIFRLEKEINDIKNSDPNSSDPDFIQRKLHNREVSLSFIKEYLLKK